MINIRILLILLISFSLSACDGLFSSDVWDYDDSDDCDEDTTTVTFKQVGYWVKDDIADLDDIDDYNTYISSDQLTHLIFGYIVPNADGSFDTDSDGTLTDDDELQDAIDNLQANGVKVLFSIGGSSGTSNLQTIAADDDLTDDFVDNVESLVDEYGLDGIDLSWQFPDDDDEGDDFQDLVEALNNELDVLLTIEVVSGLDNEEGEADVIDSDVFDSVDFVNIRAFNTDDSDDLYITEDALLDVISYWTDRCLIQNKRVVGIPVYGTGDSGTYNYGDIVDSKSDKSTYACASDDTASVDGNTYYFNAIPTVEDKTGDAQDDAGGVMLSRFDQDYLDGLDDSTDYSLLNAIYNKINGNTGVCD